MNLSNHHVNLPIRKDLFRNSKLGEKSRTNYDFWQEGDWISDDDPCEISTQLQILRKLCPKTGRFFFHEEKGHGLVPVF